jgi:hypothetical protein
MSFSHAWATDPNGSWVSFARAWVFGYIFFLINCSLYAWGLGTTLTLFPWSTLYTRFRYWWYFCQVVYTKAQGACVHTFASLGGKHHSRDSLDFVCLARRILGPYRLSRFEHRPRYVVVYSYSYPAFNVVWLISLYHRSLRVGLHYVFYLVLNLA